MSFDIETLGSRRPTSAVVQIGAACFGGDELDVGAWPGEDLFEVKISLDDCLRHGLTVDEGSFLFWMDQPDEARKAVFKGEKKPLANALQAFGIWAKARAAARAEARGIDRRDVRITMWSHATFDPPVVGNAYAAAGLSDKTMPAPFRNWLDLRTVLRMVWDVKESFPRPEREGAAHDALSDAMFQGDGLRLTLAEHRRRADRLAFLEDAAARLASHNERLAGENAALAARLAALEAEAARLAEENLRLTGAAYGR